MKSKQPVQVLTAGLILLTLLAAASAQPAPKVSKPTPAVHPTAGFSGGGGGGGQTADPATGLPVISTAAPEWQWLDPNWDDPDITLTNVKYDNIPLSEVARDLRERFKGQFNILPMPNTYGKSWGDETPIQLELKNVRASDVFGAMNLVFENDQTPLRWELKAKGQPLAQLRVLPAAAPHDELLPPPPPAETQRLVIFVGNLLGDEKAGGMSMEQLVKTISEIWPNDFGNLNKVITFHKDAQMLVVNGTRPQLDFIQQTLQALRRKAELARPKDNDLKDLEELGKVLQKEPYSNILRNIFKSGEK